MLANKEYKESGVVWLGKLPAHWDVDKIGSVYTERRTIVSDEEYEPLSVTKTGIVPQLDNAAKSDAHDNRKLVVAGDFVINSRSDRKGSSGISNLDGSVSLINTVLEPRANMNNKYYNFVFKTDMFCDEFYKWGHGIVADLWTTRWTDMKNIYVPRPDLSEQKAIADYLDKGCARIDGIVTTQRQIIEKLKEYKKSVITEAVTCGLNPDAPMKDSGIEWIGNIPEHWEVRKLNMLADVFGRIGFRGYTQNDLVAENEGAITLSPSNISDMFANYNKCSYLSWYKYNESPEIQIHNNDIIFVKTGSSYGKSCLITNLPKEATINPQLIVFKNLKIDPKLFLYMLQSESTEHQIQLIVVGGTIPTMSQEKIKKIVFVLPPMEEQREILYYLDQKCAEIDSVIEKREKMIELLTEYKKSLIYECVTGKKEIVDVVE